MCGDVAVLGGCTAGVVQSYSKISDSSGNFGSSLGIGDNFGSAVAGPARVNACCMRCPSRRSARCTCVAIAAIGDVNSDGVTDIVVGAPDDDDGGSFASGTYANRGGAPPIDLSQH